MDSKPFDYLYLLLQTPDFLENMIINPQKRIEICGDKTFVI